MKTTAAAAGVVSSLLLPLAGMASAQNVLHLGLQRSPNSQFVKPSSSRLLKRATDPAPFLQTMVNNITGGGYYAEITVGTPPQTQNLVVDTGSSDVWVVAYDADLCTDSQLQFQYRDTCSYTYNPKKSSTYKSVSQGDFSITYLDQSSASGDYISDTVSTGGANITSLQLGYAKSTVRSNGIMGIGYNGSEAANEIYPNLLDEFVDQGLIKSKTFSLYLNDFFAETGSILFGGADTDKFIGELTVLPILQSNVNGTAMHKTFAVAMSGLSAVAKEGDGSQEIPLDRLPAILDSGTTMTFLPGSIADKLYAAVNAYTDTRETGYTFIDCNESATMTINFVLSTFNVTIPASLLVLDVFADVQDQIPQWVPFNRTCLFGIQNIDTFKSTSVTTDIALLGDTFLRAVYAVYDLTHNQIGLAPANLNSTTSSIVELDSSGSSLPMLTGVKSQQTTATSQVSGTATGSSGISGTGSVASATATKDDNVVTVTASPAAAATTSSSAATSVHGPLGLDALFVAGIATLFSIVRGPHVIA